MINFNNRKFPCDKCGACCKMISNIKELEKYDLGNGRCKFLDGNRCSIYEDRPDVCKTDVIYKKYYKQDLSLDEYHNMLLKLCQEIKELTS